MTKNNKVIFVCIFTIIFTVKCNPICVAPYSCTTLQECGLRHVSRGTNEILFYCETGKKSTVCCPPVDRRKPVRNSSTTKLQVVSLTSEMTTSTENVKEDLNPLRQDSQLNKEYYERDPTDGNSSNPLASHRNFRLLPTKEECGQSFEDKIVEGEDASLGQFPWMALIGFRNATGHTFYVCGGTLISQRYVLTAAHCLKAGRAVLDHVRLGEHDMRSAADCNSEEYCQTPDDIPVEAIIPHENWNKPPLKNDITLLRLSRNAINSTRNILPICLPLDSNKLNIKDESHFRIAGWGKTEWSNRQGSSILKHANIDGISMSECQICQEKRPPRYCPLDERQMCVQGVHGVDVCKGDSGGPLMTFKTFPTYQVGITSFKSVEECGAENIPSIFTRVDKYLEWILDNIEE